MPAENVARDLLRKLATAGRISPAEFDSLQSPTPEAAKRVWENGNDYKVARNLKMLLIDERLAPAEYNILHSAQENGIRLSAWTVTKGWALDIFDRLSGYPPYAPAKSDAVDRVFDIPELLERILVYVPVTDLVFRISLTCKRFHQSTITSSALLRRLYLQPDPACPRTKLLPFTLLGRKWMDNRSDSLLPTPDKHWYDMNLGMVAVKRLRAYANIRDRLLLQAPANAAMVQVTLYPYSPRVAMDVRLEKGPLRIGDILDAVYDVYKEKLANDDRFDPCADLRVGVCCL